MPTLQHLTFNLGNSPIRTETLHGKPYVVAPVAMLTEGVHNGSGGPLLYKEADVKQAVPAWNMKPIVVYHPQINGKGVSACDPDVLETHQVGMVMNTTYNGKLRAEAWIDETLANKVDERVMQALEENKMMEVSTGLFTDNVAETGEWNGEQYEAVATNHQPDHLALLPDKIGACSIADGAGLLQLNEAAEAAGKDVSRILARQMDVMRRMVGNALSHSNISQALHMKIKEGRKENEYSWIVDVYDDFFVYEHETNDGTKLYKLSYTASDSGVEVSGEPEEVIRVTEYRTASNGIFVGNNAPQPKQEKTMNKEDIVNGLIANADTDWAEADREALMGMDEAVLAKIAPKAPAPKAPDAPTGNEEGELVTLEAYIENAPAELRDVLLDQVATHASQKAALIAEITANEKNPFTKEFLDGKGVQELQGLAALAKSNQPAQEPQSPPMFLGSMVPTGPTANQDTEVKEEPLPVPTMNFAAGE